jgi:hypothetical protein
MAEIVVVAWDAGGNVPPALAIADELSARGHGIRILGHRGHRAEIEASGHAVVGPRRARDFTAGDTHSTGELLATLGDRGMGLDLLAELQRRPADLVLVDALLLAPWTRRGAQASGTPCSSTATTSTTRARCAGRSACS